MTEKRDIRKRTDEQLSREGGKESWERTVDSIPSDEAEDPKQNEPRRGDLSSRDGEGVLRDRTDQPKKQR